MLSGRLHRVCVVAAVMAGMWAIPALAATEAATPSQDDNVSRLEALLEAQQQKIDVLEQQVAAQQQQDTDKARVDQMKAQIREVLSEREFRESLMSSTTQAGYDKGFFIRSTDDKFMLKFNGLAQFRWTYYGTRDKNRYLAPGFRRHDRAGFDFARLRMSFSGYAYTKDLSYFIELDQSGTKAGPYNTDALYAWINYRFVDEFQFKAGIFRVASTRADFGSTATMQFPEYPQMNAVFGLTRGTGVRFWGKLFNKQVEYYLDIVNSMGTAATMTITNDEDLYASGHDNNPAIMFRTVWHVLAGQCATPTEDSSNHFTTPCDMEYHSDPAFDLGFHYAFKEDYHDGTLRIPFPRKTFFRKGGFGLTSSDGLQINQFGLDASFKWMGFSTTGEYVIRLLDVRSAEKPPFTPLFLMTGDDSTNAQHGAYVQCGYFLPIPGLEKKLEVVGRVGGISTLSSGQEGTWDYGGGVNYYIEGQKVKLQADVVKVSEVPISSPQYSQANVNDDALIFRVQLQFAF